MQENNFSKERELEIDQKMETLLPEALEKLKRKMTPLQKEEK